MANFFCHRIKIIIYASPSVITNLVSFSSQHPWACLLYTNVKSDQFFSNNAFVIKIDSKE